MDLHSVFADPDPAILLNADPDPAAFLMRIRIQPNKICNTLPNEELKKTKKIAQKSKVKKHEACPNLLNFFYIPTGTIYLLSTNFHAFFLFLSSNFVLLDPGSGR